MIIFFHKNVLDSTLLTFFWDPLQWFFVYILYLKWIERSFFFCPHHCSSMMTVMMLKTSSVWSWTNEKEEYFINTALLHTLRQSLSDHPSLNWNGSGRKWSSMSFIVLFLFASFSFHSINNPNWIVQIFFFKFWP